MEKQTDKTSGNITRPVTSRAWRPHSASHSRNRIMKVCHRHEAVPTARTSWSFMRRASRASRRRIGSRTIVHVNKEFVLVDIATSPKDKSPSANSSTPAAM